MFTQHPAGVSNPLAECSPNILRGYRTPSRNVHPTPCGGIEPPRGMFTQHPAGVSNPLAGCSPNILRGGRTPSRGVHPTPCEGVDPPRGVLPQQPVGLSTHPRVLSPLPLGVGPRLGSGAPNEFGRSRPACRVSLGLPAQDRSPGLIRSSQTTCRDAATRRCRFLDFPVRFRARQLSF